MRSDVCRSRPSRGPVLPTPAGRRRRGRCRARACRCPIGWSAGGRAITSTRAQLNVLPWPSNPWRDGAGWVPAAGGADKSAQTNRRHPPVPAVRAEGPLRGDLTTEVSCGRGVIGGGAASIGDRHHLGRVTTVTQAIVARPRTERSGASQPTASSGSRRSRARQWPRSSRTTACRSPGTATDSPTRQYWHTRIRCQIVRPIHTITRSVGLSHRPHRCSDAGPGDISPSVPELSPR